MSAPPVDQQNFYAGGLLDRADGVREDEAWVADRLARPDSRLLLMSEGQPLVRPDGESVRPVWLPLTSAEAVCGAGEEPPLLLGLRADRALFAREVGADPRLAPTALGAPAEAAFVSLRTLSTRLAPDEANLCVHAKGLLWWNQRSRYCGVCGHPTQVRSAGNRRRCSNECCSAEHFPRTDPAVIMLVTHDDHALLGRSPRFVARVYSALAGFVEPGESLEDAVAREVFEETGVHLTTVRYHSSQPWPFPGAIMLGFTAVARERVLVLNRDELQDAFWITRVELRAALAAGELALPRPESIARRLIEDWLAHRV